MLESRRFQRVKLPRPIEAKIGAAAVSLIDISLTGLQVHHQEPLPPRDQRCVLRFAWNGKPIQLECVVIWSAIHKLARSASERPTLSTGLRVDSEHPAFAEMVAHFLDGKAETTTSHRFLFCELVRGSWKQVRTSSREQPPDGFTVSVDEDAAQVARLCSAYANGDAETRKLIRTLAALSINRQESTA